MDTPENSLAKLAANPYPGRGICVGLDETGTIALQVYWIMGRSPNSRNRIFVVDGPTLRTTPADPAKLVDPSLVIYNAMRELPGAYIVSNGDQTDTIFEMMNEGRTFAQALETREYEPDAPNFTPRISAVILARRKRFDAYMSIVRKSPLGAAAERATYEYEALPKGAGYTITTYSGAGAPLPSFEGTPYLLPLRGPARNAAQVIWDALNAENRVALAVKSIDLATGLSAIDVINGYEGIE